MAAAVGGAAVPERSTRNRPSRFAEDPRKEVVLRLAGCSRPPPAFGGQVAGPAALVFGPASDTAVVEAVGSRDQAAHQLMETSRWRVSLLQ